MIFLGQEVIRFPDTVFISLSLLLSLPFTFTFTPFHSLTFIMPTSWSIPRKKARMSLVAARREIKMNGENEYHHFTVCMFAFGRKDDAGVCGTTLDRCVPSVEYALCTDCKVRCLTTPKDSGVAFFDLNKHLLFTCTFPEPAETPAEKKFWECGIPLDESDDEEPNIDCVFCESKKTTKTSGSILRRR